MFNFFKSETFNTIIMDVWTKVKIHGLPYFLILGMLVFFIVENNKSKKQMLVLSNKIERCTEQKFNLMMETVNQNTAALQQNNDLISKFIKK